MPLDNSIERKLILATVIPFPLAHIAMGLANLSLLDSPIQTVLAMIICIMVILVVLPRGEANQLSVVQSVTAVIGVVVMDLLVNSALPYGIHPGYAAWHCGAIQMLMLALALRHRVGYAWLGITLFSMADFSSSLARGLPAVDAVALVLTPVMWVIIGSALSISFDRIAARIKFSTARQNRIQERLAAEHAREVFRTEWIGNLDKLTRPALERILAGNLDERDRSDLKLLEAELRDGIRGRGLATAEVTRAARLARRRGVKVNILDDRKTELPPALLAHSSGQLTAILDRAMHGLVLARACPLGSEHAVTILAYDDQFPDKKILIQIGESTS
jgi:GNAT superfamily N-acetyltransferase